MSGARVSASRLVVATLLALRSTLAALLSTLRFRLSLTFLPTLSALFSSESPPLLLRFGVIRT